MGRLIFLILIVVAGCWCYQNINPADFTKENIEAKMKQEKTINAVQQGREKHRLEAEKVLDQF